MSDPKCKTRLWDAVFECLLFGTTHGETLVAGAKVNLLFDITKKHGIGYLYLIWLLPD